MKNNPLILGVLLCVFLVFITGCEDVSKTTITGENFTFTTLDGETKNLSEYHGKVILLDLMGVNCQPCTYQMMQLIKVAKNYSRDEVTMLSIDVWVSGGENAQLVQEYLTAFHEQIGVELNWTFGLDDTKGTIEHIYASKGVPTLYILDKKGNVYYSHVGYEDYSVLSSKLDEALSKG
jgi:cytochrome c biogenesis protein CcmG, thiol:disulfide interchange protein DsbE